MKCVLLAATVLVVLSGSCIAPAQAWIRKLENRGEAGLWALVEWLEPAKSYIRAKKYKHVSPASHGANHFFASKIF